MFSLKTTRLNPSKIGIALWLLFAGCCALLLRVFWFPPWFWWGLLIVFVFGFFGLIVYRRARAPIYVGIDKFGAFWQEEQRIERLTFVRVNGVQLIATLASQETKLRRFFWASYRVIYRDSVPYEAYRFLRSYGAQQMLRQHTKKAQDQPTEQTSTD